MIKKIVVNFEMISDHLIIHKTDDNNCIFTIMFVFLLNLKFNCCNGLMVHLIASRYVEKTFLM